MSGISQPAAECLQCGETRASLRANRFVVCGIMSGGESPELVDDWEHHRWAPWKDGELARFGVRPEAFERHRRTRVTWLQWIACADTVRGHIWVTSLDADELGLSPGQCLACGMKEERV